MAGFCSAVWSSLRHGLLAIATCAVPVVVHAHAPEPRGVALTQDARTIAVALPGFGLLVRPEPSAPFSYVCDALLETPPSDLVTPVAFTDEGSLLVGTAAGLRLLGSDGCPRSESVSDLRDAPVFALAVSKSRPAVAYAATAGAKAGLWRSDDSGHHWSLRSPLAGAQLVTALRIHPDDPELVYMSQGVASGRSTLRVSSDGGATFTNYEQEGALTLLHVEAGTPTRLWVSGRDAQSVGNRGFAISRADAPSGPWLSKLRVNYFGGFVLDDRGTVTVGDESGGLFRSLDRGETFREVSMTAAVSCLAHADDATWACNIDTMAEPALLRLADAADLPSSVVRFADVTQLVSCAPEIAVERRCAQAWLEWQRDVLLREVAGKDAGGPVAVDAGATSSLPDASIDAAAQPPADAGHVDAADTKTVAPGRDGCSVSPQSAHAQGASSAPALWLALCSLTLVVRAHGQRRARLSREPLQPA